MNNKSDKNDFTSFFQGRINQGIPQKIGRYEIIKLLGQGSMGIVYLGRNPLLKRFVAIKQLAPIIDEANKDLKEQFVLRFLREARTLARIDHINIVKIYEIGEEDNYYIVMEYIDGEMLSEVIKGKKHLPFALLANIITQMCNGLNEIHDKALIHRDIKPGNIMITNENIIKIMDFGLVRTRDSDLTQFPQILGTPSICPRSNFKE